MKTNHASVIGKNGTKWIALLTMCLGLAALNVFGGYASSTVYGYPSPDDDSGYIDNVGAGARVSIEAVANGGMASVYVSGGGLSNGGTVYGSDVISEGLTTSYASGISYSVAASGGYSYAFVEVSW